MTKREADELALIEDNVTVDEATSTVRFHYPLIKDPELLSDNRAQAIAIETGVQSRLIKDDFEARLLVSKARVTPSSDTTSNQKVSTPRTELRGLLYLVRLISALLPGMVDKTSSIFLAGDSQCTISAMECEDRILGMWFGNRVAEIQDHMADWKRQGITVEELHHWPGTDNIADLATKGKATVRDIEAGLLFGRYT